MRNNSRLKITISLIILTLFAVSILSAPIGVYAASSTQSKSDTTQDPYLSKNGGGYSLSGQLKNVGFTTKMYDASNGMPTSDAMCLLGAKDGHMWIGGYSGVIRYDGSTFERMDTSNGLTSARGFFEDRKGRIWVGTNDNGVVVIDGEDSTHITYKDGLPTSSIRVFSEDGDGNVYIGTTVGLCYADSNLKIHSISHPLLDKDRILKLDADSNGKVYGSTAKGVIFAIDNANITGVFESAQLGIDKIYTIMADPTSAGNLYIGSESGDIFYGPFGTHANDMKRIASNGIGETQWLAYLCDRVWVASDNAIGYIDGDNLNILRDISVKGIEMMTQDYQGNIWIASSTQGVMKIVTNNFVDVMEEYALRTGTTNAICLHNGLLYIGMDKGLQIVDGAGNLIENELTRYIGDSRIRCIREDSMGNVWICTYTDEKGLLCETPGGGFVAFTKENGMPDNEVRTVYEGQNGDILVGTNGGLVIINQGQIVRTVGANDVIKNTVFLSVTQAEDGTIYVGSDGDGIYSIKGDNITRISRDEGLTSDVVMKIIRDDKNGVLWLVTSNSIEYMKNGKITQVKSFPYNNNYDMYFDSNNNAWILSSYGLYIIEVQKMLDDKVDDYRLYTVESGLPFTLTANSNSFLDSEGNLYMPGRNGAIKVNVNHFFDEADKLHLGINSIICDGEKVLPDSDGKYIIPSSEGRIQITPSIMDYSMHDPLVHVYLEGGPDDGITDMMSKLTTLEYTDLPYGSYTLHIEVIDKNSRQVLQDEQIPVTKSARFTEILIVRILFVLLLVAAAAIFVWRFIATTTVRRQYEEIRAAKEEADQANSAKTRFLANMSHEIRTPINTILGMNELTLREDTSGVPNNYSTRVINNSYDIKNASESLLNLVNDLLDMSKIESGKMHLVEQEYDIEEEIRSVVTMIRERSDQKELIFDAVIDEVLPTRMYGDPSKIKQVVLNLLTNAVKYTKKGGVSFTVTLSERKGDIATLQFSVRDTGMGIKKEDMDKLFDAYERLDEEKNSAIQGTGLGLDISRRFTELMGGELTCESTYGEGSEFVLKVEQRIIDDTPIGVFKERDKSSTQDVYVPQFIAPDADVLVVDDNQMNLNVIKGLLRPTKVFVNTALSGEDALDKIRDTNFDVVFLDHMMPGMDGLETLTEIRKFNTTVPVYALTANSTAGEEFYKSKGFDGCLHKPIDTKLLEETIKKHLPDEKMIEPTAEDAVEVIDKMPEDMMWIYETEGVNAREGIKNSGGIGDYLYALEMFLDTIDENIKIIRDSYDEENIGLFTIKVHALKSSARIIGADKLSNMAQKLEDAGNEKDVDYINKNVGQFISDYEAYKEKLSPMKKDQDSDNDKEMIPEDVLEDAYEALSDVIDQMDLDAVEMIVDDVDEYKLPDEDAKRFNDLKKAMKLIDWDKMNEAIRRD